MAELIINYTYRVSWVMVPAILLYGWFSPALMVVTFICMIAPVAFSFKYGRAWCGNFCPRSSFSNSVLSLITPGKKIPRIFKINAFRIMIFMGLMSLFVYNLYHTHGSLILIGRAFLKMMLITTIIQVFLGILIHQNAWCLICPMGTAAYYITKIYRKTDIFIGFNDTCKQCSVCKKVCPVQIDIPNQRHLGKISDADCMKCRKCINTCPNKTLKLDTAMH